MEMVIDVLRAVNEGGERTSYIMRRTNTNYPTLQRILSALRERGLLWVDDIDGRTRYKPTESGREFDGFARSLQAALPFSSDMIDLEASEAATPY